MTFYDALWDFVTFYDVSCQVKKATAIVIKCCKESQDVTRCCKVSQSAVLAVPFWISPSQCTDCKILSASFVHDLCPGALCHVRAQKGAPSEYAFESSPIGHVGV